MFGLMWIGKGRYPSWSGLASRRNLNGLLIWGVICIFTTITGTMLVANVAHFSGLLFGMAVGWLWLAPRRKTIWWAPVILLTITASLSLFWLPWSAEWWYYKASKAFQSKNFRLAVTNYHHSLRLGGNRYYNWENIKRAWVNLAIDAEERKDLPARQEAEKQIESAERLEGPDPDKQPEKQSTPGIHRRTQSQ
jgi:GlpG protein